MSVADEIIDRVIGELKFNADGIIPAIAQCQETGEVLMMAWMNEDSIRETLENDRVVYWSRSRQELWRKGDTSGHTQELKELRYDCDNDCILLLVNQKGPACHTNRPSCFYKAVRTDGVEVLTEPLSD